MSCYSRVVLPHLIDFAMSQREAMRMRAEHVPSAEGTVLEIGIGSGLNLAFYTSAVTKVYGIDPSAELLAMARKRPVTPPLEVELIEQSAERVPLGDASIDTIVITWSLCSISNPATALREARRVLKADGSLIFVEHGLSPDAGVKKWQNRLTPLWRHVAGGCHLNRDIKRLIADAGFRLASLRTGYVPGPKPFTFIYEGRATGI